MPMLTRKLKSIDTKTPRKFNVFLRQPKTIQKSPNESGKVQSIPRDKSRRALPPGKRISKFGNIYWETRKNRSDIKNRL